MMSRKAGKQRSNLSMGITELTRPIQTMGGHFSAFLDNRQNEPPGDQFFESARACLYALLVMVKPAKIYIPNYICDAVTQAIMLAEIPVEKYAIGGDFKVLAPLELARNEVILLVNYFGLTAETLLEQMKCYPKDQVILDCSQAYFYEAPDCLAAIYSPRKFLPVPDGGFIKTHVHLPNDAPDEDASIGRYQYLLQRVVKEVEHSRSLYLQSEDELGAVSIKSMSSFSRAISKTIDLEFIQARRRENYGVLQSLDRINRIRLPLGQQVPLCYPLMISNGEAVRARLIESRIFTPKYWPDVNPVNEFENSLLRDVVYLPIDHRYGKEQMRALIDFFCSMV